MRAAFASPTDSSSTAAFSIGLISSSASLTFAYPLSHDLCDLLRIALDQRLHRGEPALVLAVGRRQQRRLVLLALRLGRGLGQHLLHAMALLERAQLLDVAAEPAQHRAH